MLQLMRLDNGNININDTMIQLMRLDSGNINVNDAILTAKHTFRIKNIKFNLP